MNPTKPDHFDLEVCKPFYHEGNDCGILLIHGFTGSAAHMRKLADILAGRGYTVHSINLPGHASTEEEMGKADWQQWLQASKEATRELLNKCHTTAVCGLSMGGVLALLIAQQMKIDACIPISAPMAVQTRLMPLARYIAPFYKRIAWGTPSESRKLLDPAYDYGYTGFPTAKASDLSHLIKLAKRNLFNITCPTLCVQSDADETIWAKSADYILDNIISETRQKLWLSGVPHVCTISAELPAIANAIDNFLQKVREEKSAE